MAGRYKRGLCRQLLAVGLISLAANGVISHGAAADEQSLEYSVKAVFLLNFTKFVEWPADAFNDPTSPLAICILGDDPFGSALHKIAEGDAVSGRKLTISNIRRAPAEKTCQVIFVSGSEKEGLKSIPGLGPGVLTVGEGDTFLRSGGMISFVLENRRVRFDINQSKAEQAGLVVSSRLLNVARKVEK